MCGRGVRPQGVELPEVLEAELVDEDLLALPVRYNLAPTEPLGILWRDAGRRRLSVAGWGIPRPGGAGLAINARADRLGGGLWRGLMARGRAVIPLRGFYEWQRPQRQPWYFRRADGGLLLMAGVLRPERSGLHAAIITTEPSADLEGIHDRMPALLEPGAVEAWLGEDDPRARAELLGPAPAGTLARHPVSTAVNHVRSEGPQLIEPAVPAPTQGELF